MPINTGLTFAVGGIVGWLLVKIMRPKPPSPHSHLEGLIIATCSSGKIKEDNLSPVLHNGVSLKM